MFRNGPADLFPSAGNGEKEGKATIEKRACGFTVDERRTAAVEFLDVGVEPFVWNRNLNVKVLLLGRMADDVVGDLRNGLLDGLKLIDDGVRDVLKIANHFLDIVYVSTGLLYVVSNCGLGDGVLRFVF